jgi:virginiamycin B lyase
VNQVGEVKEFALPSNGVVGEIVAASDGNLWFTGPSEGEVSRISATGERTGFPLGQSGPNFELEVESIAPGSFGSLWAAIRSRRGAKERSIIEHLEPSGVMARFVMRRNIGVRDIVVGPDGNLWFTERFFGRIGRMTPTGEVSLYPLNSRNRRPAGLAHRRIPEQITVGPDGNLWFSERFDGTFPGEKNAIGRITTQGLISQFPLPGRSGTSLIAAGSEGPIWFTFEGSSGGPRFIGSVTPGGAVSGPWCLPVSCQLAPNSIAAGPEGGLLFSAGTYYSHSGGGGSGITETMEEEREAGIVSSFVP